MFGHITIVFCFGVSNRKIFILFSWAILFTGRFIKANKSTTNKLHLKCMSTCVVQRLSGGLCDLDVTGLSKLNLPFYIYIYIYIYNFTELS